MRKNIISIVALVAILVVFCVLWSVPTETYTNVGYGYSFDYPSTHYIRQEPDDFPYPDKYDRWIGISIDNKYKKTREYQTLFSLLTWPSAPENLDHKSFAEFYAKDTSGQNQKGGDVILTHFKNVDAYCFDRIWIDTDTPYSKECIFENSKKERFKFSFKESNPLSKIVLDSLIFQ